MSFALKIAAFIAVIIGLVLLVGVIGAALDIGGNAVSIIEKSVAAVAFAVFLLRLRW